LVFGFDALGRGIVGAAKHVLGVEDVLAVDGDAMRSAFAIKRETYFKI
jgi:hypothetical protein